jgi:hypothetical protein
MVDITLDTISHNCGGSATKSGHEAPLVEPLRKKRQLQQAKESKFLLGVQCGANAAKHLINSGWTDMDKLEHEILRRVRGK